MRKSAKLEHKWHQTTNRKLHSQVLAQTQNARLLHEKKLVHAILGPKEQLIPLDFTAVRGTLSCPSLEGETSSRTHSSPVYTAISTPPSGRSSTAGMTPTSSWRTSGMMTTSTAATDWAATDSCDRGTCGVTTRPLQSLRIILVIR